MPELSYEELFNQHKKVLILAFQQPWALFQLLVLIHLSLVGSVQGHTAAHTR